MNLGLNMVLAVQKIQHKEKINISAPVLTIHANKAFWLNFDGEILEPNKAQLNKLIQQNKPIVCHAGLTAKRLEIAEFLAYDLLELFAFVHPTKFCIPNLNGLISALDIPNIEVNNLEGQLLSSLEVANKLLLDLQKNINKESSNVAEIALIMGLGKNGIKNGQGWAWADLVIQALGLSIDEISAENSRNSLKIWHKLPEWAEESPPPPASHMAISQDEVVQQLNKILRQKSSKIRIRKEQEIYTKFITNNFQPSRHKDDINIAIAEAGTGTGKTLAYLAPASVWAQKNEDCVWLSTYTKNLQKQIDNELDNLYKNPADKVRNIVIRKGRENYLCLLNLEEAVNSPAIQNNVKYATAIGIIARWATKTRDGDIYGGDFPGWLVDLLGWRYTYGLADRRGECIFAACPHFHKCFIEKSNRLAKRAKIVIANHALVMHKAAASHPQEIMPSRYIFDEGHHIFSAADSAFSIHLSGREAAELRYWILGRENSNYRNGRGRGLKQRIEDLISNDDEAIEALDEILKNSRILPSKSWLQRLQSEQPKGLVEGFLFLVRQQIYARNKNNNDLFYSLETEALPPIDGLFETAYTLALRLKDILKPIKKIIKILQQKLEKHADVMETDTKLKIESVCHSLTYRAENLIQCWIDMLGSIQNQTIDERFVDWFQLERITGQEHDVGMYRHWIDPTIPFADSIKSYANGITITSASLLDSTNPSEEEWNYALKYSSACNISNNINKLQISSPYDYQKQSRILVINNVNINNIKHIASAYFTLFKASNGGALGLFTAIQRLKAVHGYLLPKMQQAKIELYAQHIDGLDTSTLTEIFKMEINSCMLGTDATRDGIDIPGKSLRLIIFERVPWARPDILHKARRKYFGTGYDDKITRAKLKQAYGRLIRHENDKGIFVMLDSRLPSRLCSAFPKDVKIERLGLADAVKIIRNFY